MLDTWAIVTMEPDSSEADDGFLDILDHLDQRP